AAGEPQAHMLHALLLASSGSGSPQPDCNAAVLGLLDAARLISSDDAGFARGDLLILAAQIDLACDQPAERRPARALSALQSLPNELQEDHQELIAYASCM